MTRHEDAHVWFSAIEEKNYAKINELVATFQGSRDKYGDTGLMLAARQGDTKIVQILLPYEAGLANKDNQTALIVAALCDRAKACRFLVASEKDCLLCDGRDALMLAAQVGNTSAVDALVDHFPAIRDNNGTSALDYAAGEGYLECVQIIVRRQDLTVDDLEHAVNIAMARKNFDVVSYLNTVRNTMFKSSMGMLGESSASEMIVSTVGRTTKFALDASDNFQGLKSSSAKRKLNRSVSDISTEPEPDLRATALMDTGSQSHLQSDLTSSKWPQLETRDPEAGVLKSTISEAQHRVVQLTDTLNKIDEAPLQDLTSELMLCKEKIYTLSDKNKELESLLSQKEEEVKALKEDLCFLLSAREDDSKLIASKDDEINRLKSELALLEIDILKSRATVPNIQTSIQTSVIADNPSPDTLTLTQSNLLKSIRSAVVSRTDSAASKQEPVTSQPTDDSNVIKLELDILVANQRIVELEEANVILQRELAEFRDKIKDLKSSIHVPKSLSSSVVSALNLNTCSLESSMALPVPVQLHRTVNSVAATALSVQPERVQHSLAVQQTGVCPEPGEDVEQLKTEIAQLTATIQVLSEELVAMKDEKIQGEAELERIIAERDAAVASMSAVPPRLAAANVVSCSTGMSPVLPVSALNRSMVTDPLVLSLSNSFKGKGLDESLPPPFISSHSNTPQDKQVSRPVSPLGPNRQTQPLDTHHSEVAAAVANIERSTVRPSVLDSVAELLSSKGLQTSVLLSKIATEAAETSQQTSQVGSTEPIVDSGEYHNLVLENNSLKAKELMMEHVLANNDALAKKVEEAEKTIQELTAKESFYTKELKECHMLISEKANEVALLSKGIEELEIDRNTLMTSYQHLRQVFDELTVLKIEQDRQIEELSRLLNEQSQAFHDELDQKNNLIEGLNKDMQSKDIQLSTLEYKIQLLMADLDSKQSLLSEQASAMATQKTELEKTDVEHKLNEDLRWKMQNYESEVTTLRETVANLTRINQSLEENLSQTSRDLIAKEVRLDSYTAINADLVSRLETSSRETDILKTKVFELELANKTLADEHERVRRLLVEEQTKATALASELDRLSVVHKDTTERYESIKRELEATRNDNNRMITELNATVLSTKQSVSEQTNRELLYLKSELEVKSASLNSITNELSAAIRAKDEEISNLKQKVKKYKTAYLEIRTSGDDVAKEIVARELGKYEHGMEIAHKEVMELRVANAELKAAMDMMQAQDTESDDLKQKSKKYKEGYIRKCKQLEDLEHELEALKKTARPLNTLSMHTEAHRLIEAVTQTTIIGTVSREVMTDLSASLSSSLRVDGRMNINNHDVSYMYTEQLQDNTREIETLKGELKRHINTYNIVCEELFSTREQLEGHIRMVIEKDNEIKGLKALIQELQGGLPELEKAMAEVALSALNIDDEQYNSMVKQVDESIEMSIRNCSISLTTSNLLSRSIGLSFHEKSLLVDDDSIISRGPNLPKKPPQGGLNISGMQAISSLKKQNINAEDASSDGTSLEHSTIGTEVGGKSPQELDFSYKVQLSDLREQNERLLREIKRLQNANDHLQKQQSGELSASGSSLINISEYTNLMLAVIKRDRIGISVYSSQACMTTSDGTTALMLAAEHNNVEAALRLVDAEAGMIACNGDTALLISLRNSNFDVAKVLVKKEGINLTGISIGVSRLQRTARQQLGNTHVMGNSLTLTVLNMHEDDLTDLMKAVKRDDLVAAYCLASIQSGLQDRRGYTALMYAAEKGNYPMVRILMHMGSEAGKQDLQGGSALMLAARAGHLKICQLLAEKESGLVGSPDSLLAPHHTALMLACFYGHLSIVKLLLPKEYSLVSASGKTVLSYARFPCSSVSFETKNEIVGYIEGYVDDKKLLG